MWLPRIVAPPLDRCGSDTSGARRTFAKLFGVDDDRALIQKCQAGDGAAFRELFRRHRADVARLVHRMSGRRTDLEDLVQEVFMQVHRSLGSFRGDAKLSTWLYRVTVNVVLMHRRSARSRPTLLEEEVGEPPRDTAPLPDEQLARQKRIAAFWRLLDRLTDKKRTVFILHELEGLAPSKIAEIVDAPVLTVRTRLFYARRELAGMMDEEPELAIVAREIEGRSGEPPRLHKGVPS